MIGCRLAQQAEGRGTADEVEIVVILDTTTRNFGPKLRKEKERRRSTPDLLCAFGFKALEDGLAGKDNMRGTFSRYLFPVALGRATEGD